MALTSQAQLQLEIVELPENAHLETWEPNMEMVHTPEVVHMLPEDIATDTIEMPEQFELVVEELPGVEHLDPDMEKALEVVEHEDKKDKDENDARAKKNGKWDWEHICKTKGPKGFIGWIQERLQDVPKHSGFDTAGLERAVAFMERLDTEISRAMRSDLDGDLDANEIEEIRAKIDDGIERLHARLEKVKKKGKGKKRKKAEEQMELIKQAQKIPGIEGIVISVPLYVSAIARTCINGMVSGGHDIEEMFWKLAKKYNLTEREKFECIIHLQDLGLTVRQDRGLVGEEFDMTSSDNFDFNANYQA